MGRWQIDWVFWVIMMVLLALFSLGLVVSVVQCVKHATMSIREDIAELKEGLDELREEQHLHDVRLEQHNKDQLWWKAKEE